MITLGITGGIASGKTTVARMLAEAGFPVFDADAAVHAIYDRPAKSVLAALPPSAIRDGKIDRRALGALVAADDALLDRIEAAVHPLVRRRARSFLAKARRDGAAIAVLEVPLLYESGLDVLCDRFLVTTVAPEIAAARIAARGMSPALRARFEARQMPSTEKERRADYVVDSGEPLDVMRRNVGAIIAGLKSAAGAN